MPFPFVSRERYDEKCVELSDVRAELAELRTKYDALLVEREQPRRESKLPKPPRDPMVDKLTADLEATLGDRDKARAEAERIKREAFGGPL